MPKFEITAPDGKTYEVEGPEGSTKEQALEKVKAQHGAAPPTEQRSAVGDFFKSIPGGLVEGFSAAASAGGQAAAHEMSQPEVAAEIPSAPQTAGIIEKNVTGELPTPQGPAGRAGRTIGEFAGNPATWASPGGSTALKAGGAVASALGSWGAGELTRGHENIQPWAQVLGSLVGGVGAAKTAGAIEHIASPGTQAAADLRRAILRDGETPEALSVKLAEMQKIRPDATLADVGGENVRGLVERVAQTPGAGRTQVVPALTERQHGQMDRLFTDLTNLSGARQSALRATQETMAGRAETATPLYRQAYEEGDRAIWSPGLERLSSSPTVEGAMHGAVNIWRDNVIADGYGAMNPGAMVDRGGTLSFPGGKVPVFPNLQFWDYTKRVIDDQVGAAVRAGQNQKARTLTVLAQQLRNELDAQVPTYRAARDAWGGPSQYLNAIEEGGQIIKSTLSAEQLQARLAEMTAAEREGYRIGALSAIRGKMGNDPADMADMTKYLRSPEMKAKVAAIMPTPEAAASWSQRLGYEVGSSKLTGRSLGNSATARRLAEREDAENLVGDLVMDAMTHGATGSLWRFLMAGPKKVRDTVRSRSDAVLGSVLTEPRAPALESTLEGAARTEQPSGSAAALRAVAASPLAGSGP